MGINRFFREVRYADSRRVRFLTAGLPRGLFADEGRSFPRPPGNSKAVLSLLGPPLSTTVLGVTWYVLLFIILAVIALLVVIAALTGAGSLAKRGRRGG